VFQTRYDDVELLGKAVARTRWRPAGAALHVLNGAVFGAVHVPLRRRLGMPALPAALAAGLAEHVGLWPLGRLTDRFHPRRTELEALRGNRRAFAAATWRHLLFGALVGVGDRALAGGR
jgi:hypothetical protein